MTDPILKPLRVNDTVRLIPSKYSDNGGSVLTRIADDAQHLDAIFDLDHATNDRLLAENDLLPGIGRDELVFGIPYYRIINAAFCHASPTGGRFNSPDRGCWYAGDILETSLAEVAFHKSVALAEVGRFEDVATYDSYTADLSGNYRIIGADEPEFLDPNDYQAAQTLAEQLLDAGASGIAYPSVRADAGTCYACFRPALISNPRKGVQVTLTWSGAPTPTVEITDP